MVLSKSEEDFLKATYALMLSEDEEQISNQQLSKYLDISPPSVNNMAGKLSDKELLLRERYGKLKLSEKGSRLAVSLIRKHRLWETFLCKYLNFSWDEVHEIAEQLEHIKSVKLVRELDRFLGYPEHDPHGHPIPKENEIFKPGNKTTLSEMKKDVICKVVAVKDSSEEFLRYLTQIGLTLGTELQVLEVLEFDESVQIAFENQSLFVSKKFAEHVFVEVKTSLT